MGSEAGHEHERAVTIYRDVQSWLQQVLPVPSASSRVASPFPHPSG